MRSAYFHRAEEVLPTGATALAGERVPNGKVLLLTHLSVYWSGVNAADYMFPFLKHGGVKYYLAFVSWGITYTVIGVNCPFLIGEGDQIGVEGSFTSTPGSVYMNVIGELQDNLIWCSQDNHPSQNPGPPDGIPGHGQHAVEHSEELSG